MLGLVCKYFWVDKTRTTVPTDGREPLDADSISDLDAGVLGPRAQLDDVADALVATNLTISSPARLQLLGLAHL